MQFLPTPTHLHLAPVTGDLLEFHQHLWYQKTKSPGSLCRDVCNDV